MLVSCRLWHRVVQQTDTSILEEYAYIWVGCLLASHAASQHSSPHIQDNPQMAEHVTPPLQKSQWLSDAQRLFNCLLPNFLCCLRLQDCRTVKFVNSQLPNFYWNLLGTKSRWCLQAVTVLFRRSLKTEWEDGAWSLWVMTCGNAEWLQCIASRYVGLRYSGKQSPGKMVLCVVGENDT